MNLKTILLIYQAAAQEYNKDMTSLPGMESKSARHMNEVSISKSYWMQSKSQMNRQWLTVSSDM